MLTNVPHEHRLRCCLTRDKKKYTVEIIIDVIYPASECRVTSDVILNFVKDKCIPFTVQQEYNGYKDQKNNVLIRTFVHVK